MILVLEVIGSTTTLVYGLNHLFYTVDEDLPKRTPRYPPVTTAMGYHIRCLVPCYKESLQILQVRCAETRDTGLEVIHTADSSLT